MAAETYCGQLTATTKIVDSGGPEPEQIGDLLLRKDVRPFERAVTPGRGHDRPPKGDSPVRGPRVGARLKRP